MQSRKSVACKIRFQKNFYRDKCQHQEITRFFSELKSLHICLMQGQVEGSQKKRRFTPEEDNQLKSLVQEIGTNDWNLIASKMNDRTTRQVKDRWVYYLSPALNTREWSKEEDSELTDLVKKFGKKWIQVSAFFEGRTEIAIKNRWNLLQRTQKRRFQKYKTPIKEEITLKSDESEPESEPIIDQITFKFDEPSDEFIEPYFDFFAGDTFDEFGQLMCEWC